MVWVFILEKREHNYDLNIKHNYELKTPMTEEEQFHLIELKKLKQVI